MPVRDARKAPSEPAPTSLLRVRFSFCALHEDLLHATTPDELKRAVDAAMDSGKPTLINAVIDPAAGSESGRIGNLNPQSVLKKK